MSPDHFLAWEELTFEKCKKWDFQLWIQKRADACFGFWLIFLAIGALDACKELGKSKLQKNWH